MSRILEAIQRLEEDERAEDRSVIPIFEGLAKNVAGSAPSPTGESSPSDVSESDVRVFVRRFDSSHGETNNLEPPHFGKDDVQAATRATDDELEQRVMAICTPYLKTIPAALKETWVLSAMWKTAATHAGWISSQVVDPHVPIECALALSSDVCEKIGQSVLLIDGDPSSRLTRTLGLSPECDLIDVMLGRATLEESLIRLTRGGLYCLPIRQVKSGWVLPNWADVNSLFQAVRQAFGFAVAFCPMSDDPLSLRILRNSDEFWLWCAAGSTPAGQIKKVIQSASPKGNPAGAVLISL